MDPHGLLFILTDVAPADEPNFNRWYDREHLGDRIEAPGFTSARRYQRLAAGRWKHLALYEAEDLGTFSSPAYKERLANQSPWSKQVLPLFVDPQRTIAKEVARCGVGFGSYISVLAFRADPDTRDASAEHFSKLATSAIEEDDNLLRMRLFSADPELSRPVAEYKQSRPSPIGGEHWFAFSEASDPASLQGIPALMSTLPSAHDPFEVGDFRLRIGVDRGDIETTHTR